MFTVLLTCVLSLNLVSARAVKKLWHKNRKEYRGTRLTPGQTMKTGDYLLSDNCIFQMILQPDGNLVVNKNVAGVATPKWDALTELVKEKGEHAYTKLGKVTGVVFQNDGNFCTTVADGRPVWCTHTAIKGNLPEEMAMQSDGNLVYYAEKGAGWQSKTGDDKSKQDHACFSCTNVKISDWKIQKPRRSNNAKNLLMSYHDSGCGLSEKVAERTVHREDTTEVTQSYSFTQSMSKTFAVDLSQSITLSASSGVKAGVVESNQAMEISVSASQHWEKTVSSESTTSTETKKSQTLASTFTVPLIIPGAVNIDYVIHDEFFVTDVPWSATGTCYDENGGVLERQTIHGSYKDVQFHQVNVQHEIAYDCPAVPTPPPTSPPTSYKLPVCNGDGCCDRASFKDERNLDCAAWKGYKCEEAVKLFGYSVKGQGDLLLGCKNSCGKCPKVGGVRRRLSRGEEQ